MEEDYSVDPELLRTQQRPRRRIIPQVRAEQEQEERERLEYLERLQRSVFFTNPDNQLIVGIPEPSRDNFARTQESRPLNNSHNTNNGQFD